MPDPAAPVPSRARPMARRLTMPAVQAALLAACVLGMGAARAAGTSSFGVSLRLLDTCQTDTTALGRTAAPDERALAGVTSCRSGAAPAVRVTHEVAYGSVGESGAEVSGAERVAVVTLTF